MTPLIDAVLNGVYDDVLNLLIGGTNPNEVDEEWGTTALFIATEFANFEIAKLLIQYGANPNLGVISALFQSIFSNQSILTKLYLANGGDPNLFQSGTTILHLATFYSYFTAVQEILFTNVNVNAKDNVGNVALHYSVYKNNYNISQALIAKKSDPTIKSNRGKSPLDYACFFGLNDIVKLMKGEK